MAAAAVQSSSEIKQIKFLQPLRCSAFNFGPDSIAQLESCRVSRKELAKNLVRKTAARWQRPVTPVKRAQFSPLLRNRRRQRRTVHAFETHRTGLGCDVLRSQFRHSIHQVGMAKIHRQPAPTTNIGSTFLPVRVRKQLFKCPQGLADDAVSSRPVDRVGVFLPVAANLFGKFNEATHRNRNNSWMYISQYCQQPIQQECRHIFISSAGKPCLLHEQAGYATSDDSILIETLVEKIAVPQGEHVLQTLLITLDTGLDVDKAPPVVIAIMRDRASR